MPSSSRRLCWVVKCEGGGVTEFECLSTIVMSKMGWKRKGLHSQLARLATHCLDSINTRLVEEEMGEEQKVAGRSQNSRNPELRARQTLLLSPFSPAPWCNTDFLCVAIQTRPSSLHPMTALMLGLSPVKRKTHEMDTHPCSIPLTRLCSGRSLL
jgi:hypothetical protein